MPRKNVLRELFKDRIQGTPYKSAVVDKTMFLCSLTYAVLSALEIKPRKIYATSRFLKHLYDKKPAEEFDFLIEHLHKIVKYPDVVYRNKTGKRGHWCLTKEIGGQTYLCALEVGVNAAAEPEIYIATAFRVRNNKYLSGYELLWSWRDDGSSS